MPVEEVTVEAGKFKCYTTKHELTFDLNAGAGAPKLYKMEITIWFAPNIGIVKFQRNIAVNGEQTLNLLFELRKHNEGKKESQ